MVSGGADKEVEVGAGVGLLDVVDVEPLPAAYGIGEAGERGGRRRCNSSSATSSVNFRSGTSRVISSAAGFQQ
jgi:hypothetical protein